MRSHYRYNPSALAALSVDDCQLAIINDTERDDANFAIILSVIEFFQYGPAEDPDSVIKVDPRFGDIGRVLGCVPFERHQYRRIVKTYSTAANPSRCACAASPSATRWRLTAPILP